MDELTWLQRYAGEEVVEQARAERLDRREVLRRLVGICGTPAAAAALLAACSGDDLPDASPTTSAAAGTAATSAPASTAAGVTSSAAAPAPGSSIVSNAEPGATLAEPPPPGTGAVLSVAADDPDVRGQDIVLPGPAGDVLGYLAVPTAPGTRAGVLVIHEISGLTDHIRDVTRRVAKAGHLALAVDLASRSGGTAAAPDVRAALTQVPVSDLVADLDAGYAHMRTLPEFTGSLGVTGFCFGGGMTLSYAAAQPDVRAAVPYYGPTPQPAEQMAATNAAILAHYGADDARVNAGIGALEEAMAGKVLQVVVHDGAGHAFNNDTRDAYVEAAAVAAWTSTLAWFAEHLG
jgi:carboxymethylenebutenolidase